MLYAVEYKNHTTKLRFQPSFPEQHISEQQVMQPKHPRPMQSCVNAVAHWLFNRAQHWMQHMQQQ